MRALPRRGRGGAGSPAGPRSIDATASDAAGLTRQGAEVLHDHAVGVADRARELEAVRRRPSRPSRGPRRGRRQTPRRRRCVTSWPSVAQRPDPLRRLDRDSVGQCRAGTTRRRSWPPSHATRSHSSGPNTACTLHASAREEADGEASLDHRHHRTGRLVPRGAAARDTTTRSSGSCAARSTVNLERISHLQDRAHARARATCRTRRRSSPRCATSDPARSTTSRRRASCTRRGRCRC